MKKLLYGLLIILMMAGAANADTVVYGSFLPSAGGAITGSVTVTGDVSANTIHDSTLNSGYVTKAGTAGLLGDSVIRQDASGNVGVNKAPTAFAVNNLLDVSGTIKADNVINSGLTASLPVFTDGSKYLASNAMTGTGKVVMDSSPTITTPTFTAPVLGTPASGAVTNLTGTASININGTVGATTPSTGAFTTATASTAIADNDSDTQLATTAYAKSQDAVLAREPNQGVALTAAASGSSGIQVADNDNIDMGTNNFALVWKGGFPDWTPAVDCFFFDKYSSGSTGYYFTMPTTGKISVDLYGAGGTISTTDTASATGFVDGTYHEIVAVVTRETASVAGSKDVYYDGVLVESIPIAAGTGGSLSSSQALNISGQFNSGKRTAGTTHHAYVLNFAPSAAEVLDMYRNGPKLAWFDPTGVSPASQTAQTSGSLVANKEYTIDTFVAGDDFSNVATVISGTINTTGCRFLATGTTPTTWTNSSSLRRTGVTWGIMPEGMQPAPGQCFDFSGHKNHAMQPATGSSLTRPKRDFEYRWTNTWTASSAAQFIGGLDQNVLTADHFITSVVTQATVTTDVKNLELGDGNDADQFVAAFTPSATRTSQTIAGQNDGTYLKLVYTPADTATMTVETIIKGFIWEP